MLQLQILINKLFNYYCNVIPRRYLALRRMLHNLDSLMESNRA